MLNDECTGVLLAGGQSRRFGSNKALARLGGRYLIEYPAQVLAGLFARLLLVSNQPGLYDFLGWPTIPDRIAGAGPLAGIEAALYHAATPYIFVAACDMPFLDPALISHLLTLAAGHDAVIPVSARGWEPLHGVYGQTALPAITAALASGENRIHRLLTQLQVRRVSEAEMAAVSTLARESFRNVNTVAELPGGG